MVKYFCDKCGKEINSGNLCDKCEYEELTYDFKVGDEVITDDGRVGKIIDICKCERCEERGFYEPEVEFDDGDTDYIDISDKNDGFGSFYKIGNYTFGNLDDSYLLSRIGYLRGEMRKLEAQLNVVTKLKSIN